MLQDFQNYQHVPFLSITILYAISNVSTTTTQLTLLVALTGNTVQPSSCTLSGMFIVSDGEGLSLN